MIRPPPAALEEDTGGVVVPATGGSGQPILRLSPRLLSPGTSSSHVVAQPPMASENVTPTARKKRSRPSAIGSVPSRMRSKLDLSLHSPLSLPSTSRRTMSASAFRRQWVRWGN